MKKLLLLSFPLCFVASFLYAQEPVILVWAKAMSGPFEDVATSVAVDAAGNVYTTEVFTNTTDFDPGPGVFNLSAAVGGIFISKLDAAGSFVWAKSIGGTNFDVGRSIAVDAAGNVYTTGHFQGTVDFDPGPGTFFLTGNDNTGSFILKLDALGNFKWVRQMEFIGSGPFLAVDAAGNVCTTGFFSYRPTLTPAPESLY